MRNGTHRSSFDGDAGTDGRGPERKGCQLNRIEELLDQATAVHAAPADRVVLITAAAALVVVVGRSTWIRVRHAVTIVHEAGHAVAALATGRRLLGIRLHSDTSGLTLSHGRPTGPGMAVTLLAGYPAPALLGLGAAALLDMGYGVGVLWIMLAVLVAVLTQIRNAFGALSVFVTGTVVVAAALWLPVGWQVVAAYAVTWFLLLASPRPVMEMTSLRRRRRARGTDADQLAGLTRVPVQLWEAGFLLANLLALFVGGRWLLP